MPDETRIDPEQGPVACQGNTSVFRLDEVIQAQKQGRASGIVSVCSSHPTVIEAALRYALEVGAPLLIESTCNQVNQYGGYTGMTPADFIRFVHEIAGRLRFPSASLILGGDHLGPSVWQAERAGQAMEKAHVLVRDYVRAGYAKIHLDASMSCADDPAGVPLDIELSAARTADLAKTAEQTFRAHDTAAVSAPRYVIGTEVPPPGGIQGRVEGMRVTPPGEVKETIEATRLAFQARGLEEAWQRVIAVVAQPGVEYGEQTIFDYRRSEAVELSRCIEAYEHLVFEAHSTDYQTRGALRQLVEDHFAILKVGPALTFAFREAVFALEMIEEELFAGREEITLSGLRRTLDEAMQANPIHWQRYYGGSPAEQLRARRYSLSDRARYYWPVPTVQAALSRLVSNLSHEPIPLSLLSQYLPGQYEQIRSNALPNEPGAIIISRIAQVLSSYFYACGYPHTTHL